jgi:hypothetical protein
MCIFRVHLHLAAGEKKDNTNAVMIWLGILIDGIPESVLSMHSPSLHTTPTTQTKKNAPTSKLSKSCARVTRALAV